MTDDPLTIQWGRKKLYIDLGAQKLLAAAKAGRKIAVEIKSFIGKSDVLDLEQALGQFMLYFDVLKEIEPDRELYLAVNDVAYKTIFEEPLGQLMLRNRRLRLIVFNAHAGEILQWIP